MKKCGNLFIVTAMITVLSLLLTGCNNNAILKKMEKSEYFSTDYDKAIKQTQISNILSEHLQNKEGVTKKAILIMIDGMSVQSLPYFYDYGKGISHIAKNGGLYWTIPDNIATRAKIDTGVNFLQIVTGKEPSTFEVLKSTDAKREAPLSIMSSVASMRSVAFLTDNENYINVQLAQELSAKKLANLKCGIAKDIHELKKNCLAEISFNKDFIVLAISTLYNEVGQNFNAGNKEYLASIINLNSYIEEIYAEINARTGEDWLVAVTSTFGGKKTLENKNIENNVLTFMASNKAIEF